MITTTLFQSCKKEISNKPERIKIKQKTYRELLGLDRPKKQIYVESDDDNDDFLEKLLKQQAKEKSKSKHSLKKSHTKKGSKQLNKNNASIKKTVKQRQNSNGSQQREMVTQSNSQSKNTKDKKDQKKENIEQNKSQEKEIKQYDLIDKKLKQEKTPIKQSQPSSPRKQEKPPALKTQSQDQNAIKVDESNEPPYIATNKLVQTLRPHLKKYSQSLMHIKTTRYEAFSSTPISIKAKLNPQRHTIDHNFSQQQKHPQFKANPLSMQKLLKMTNTDYLDIMANKKDKFAHLKQKLFKNENEEQKFVASLKSIKRKKYSLQPSLLTNL